MAHHPNSQPDQPIESPETPRTDGTTGQLSTEAWDQLMPSAEPLAHSTSAYGSEPHRSQGKNPRDPRSQDPRNQFTWSNLFLIISIPSVTGLVIGGALLLYNPLLFAWLYAPKAPIVYGSLWSHPKTIRQIRSELEEKSLTIGDVIKLDSGEQIFSVLEKETKAIQELRLYQSVSDGGVEKLISLQTARVYALEDGFVRRIRTQYATKSSASSRQPWLMQKIEALRGVPPKGLPGNPYWFSVTGSRDQMRYGQIFYFTTVPRPRLVSVAEWNSPMNQLPEWQNILSSSPNQPQLLVNQSYNSEPLFTVFKPEIDPNNQNLVRLRQITLNEANITINSLVASTKIALQPLGIIAPPTKPNSNPSNSNPATSNKANSPNNTDKETNKPPARPSSQLPSNPYQQSLWLASVGLWQDAKQKMAEYAKTLPDQKLPPFLQEQSDLINFHADLTQKQAAQELPHLGARALNLIMDGQWEAALVLLREKRSQGSKFAEMLTRDYPHIWQRVEVALAMEPEPAVKIWGGLVVLHRDGLRAAERWLKERKSYTPEAMELLQRLDLAPIAIKPEQVFGRVVFLGREKPDPDWFIPPPELESNQGWYEVTVDVIRDGEVWRNAPFPMLADRSGLLIWRLFGFDRNNKMGILLKDEDGDTRTAFLTIHSLYVNNAGELRLLATADLNIARTLNKGSIPPLVSNRGGAQSPDGIPIYLHDLPLGMAMGIVRSIYGELSRRGQLSVSLEEFVPKAQQWQFTRVDFRGTSSGNSANNFYLLLQLERRQVDLGERSYPITLIYNSDGTLVFSDAFSNERIWLGVLPSKIPGQSLTFSNGRYDVWVVR